jgi:hypothetical protein
LERSGKWRYARMFGRGLSAEIFALAALSGHPFVEASHRACPFQFNTSLLPSIGLILGRLHPKSPRGRALIASW